MPPCIAALCLEFAHGQNHQDGIFARESFCDDLVRADYRLCFQNESTQESTCLFTTNNHFTVVVALPVIVIACAVSPTVSATAQSAAPELGGITNAGNDAARTTPAVRRITRTLRHAAKSTPSLATMSVSANVAALSASGAPSVNGVGVLFDVVVL